MTNAWLKAVCAAATLAALMLPSPGAAQPAQAPEVLTNQSIIQMVTGKVSKDLIRDKIRSTPASFDISPEALVDLRANKVPDDLIEAVLRAPTKGESREVLTNESVIAMAKGDLSKKIILLKIKMTKTKFDLTSAGLISLTQNKVSSDIQKEMLKAVSKQP